MSRAEDTSGTVETRIALARNNITTPTTTATVTASTEIPAGEGSRIFSTADPLLLPLYTVCLVGNHGTSIRNILQPPPPHP